PAHDVPGVHRGPGHPGGGATRILPPRGQGHRGEGGPPPLPVAAADRRRHHREPAVTGTADLVRRLYAAFTSRDVERLLTLVTEHVDWPDGPARMHGQGCRPRRLGTVPPRGIDT